jgi:BirA family biotin operon repressor/biotin-[acetyl-CoA-carboxylase] ligase
MALELDVSRLNSLLTTARFGRSLQYLSETASTNDDARRALAEGASAGHTIVADAQTAGRGSRGRVWTSPAGTDLYVSIIDRLPVAWPDLPPLTLAVGLAVAETADDLLRDPQHASEPASQVKWPNDVLLVGRKCAGVLVETSVGHAATEGVVIGIGLNVNREHFPPELEATATSLRLEHPARLELDRTRALGILLARVEARVDQFVAHGAASIVSALEARLAHLGKRVRCNQDSGILRGVAPSGALLLETSQGLRSCFVGPIELES